MKIAKRFFSIFLVVVMLISATPLAGFVGLELAPKVNATDPSVVDSGECGADGDNVTWTLYDNGLLVISGDGAMADYVYDSTPWESYKDQINEVRIKNGVNSIGEVAFASCENLSCIKISNSVTNIGQYAFSRCTSLTEFVIPEGVTCINYYTFEGCSNLTSITIPDGVTSIENGVFSRCTGLTSIEIPKSVTNIGDYAFENCRGLTNISIPNSVTTIGESVFRFCFSLTSITIPESVTSIGDSVFQNCNSLMSITIPDSVTSIGKYSFLDCTGLTSIEIPKSVTNIGDYAFEDCFALTDVYYNGTQEQWNAITVAEGNECLTTATLNCLTILDSGECGAEGDNVTWTLYDNGLLVISGDGAMADYYPWKPYKDQINEVRIKNGVNSIGEVAFAECTSLLSVTIPASVTSIGEAAFFNCTELTSIVVDEHNENYASDENGCLLNKDLTVLLQYPIGNERTSFSVPASVTSIGDGAFNGCTGLTSVMIPASVTSIGDGAFNGCTGLTSVMIPASVTSIGEVAFSNCTELTSIVVDEHNENYASDENGCLFNKDLTVLLQYPIGNERTTFSVPNSVTSILSEAFYGCTGLTSVTIGNGTEIIDELAFANCTGLTSVTIPDSVKIIFNDTFNGCTGLTSVTIGNGVTGIRAGAFKDCSALTDVYYNGTQEQWNAITISNYNTPLTNATLHFNEPLTGCAKYSKYYTKVITKLDSTTDEYGASLTYRKKDGSTTTVSISLTNDNADHESFFALEGYPVKITAKAHGNSLHHGDVYIGVNIYSDSEYSQDEIVLVDTFHVNVSYISGGTVSGEYDIEKGTAVRTSTRGSVYAPNVNNYASLMNLHSWDGGVDTTPATCNASGVCTYTCTVCGYFYTVTTPQLQHKDENDDGLCDLCGFRMLPELAGIAVTCDESYFTTQNSNGKFVITTSHNCAGSHVAINGVTTNPSGAHNSLPSKITVYVSATADNNNASVGGTTRSWSGRVIVYINGIPAGYVDLNGSAKMYSLGDSTKDCSAEAELSFNHTPAGEGTVTTPATCVVPGEKNLNCSVCGKTYTETVAIDPANHDGHLSKVNLQKATCSADGMKQHYYCDLCGNRYLTSTDTTPVSEAELKITARGHNWNNGTVTTPPTCCESGTKTFNCLNTTATDEYAACSETKTETLDIDPANHDGHLSFVPVVESTCLAEGVSAHYYCDACEKNFSDAEGTISVSDESLIIEKGDHNYTATHFDAVGEEDGYTLYTCSVCGNNYTVLDPAIAVEGFMAYGSVNAVNLSWMKAIEASVTGYRIYKKSLEDASFELLTEISSRNTLSYVDKAVEDGTVYYYTMRAMKGDIEGDLTEPISSVALPDQEAPIVTSLLPKNGSTLSGTINIKASATDNVAVAKYTVLYSTDEGDSWTEIQSVNGTSCNISFDTTAITDGIVKVKVVAYDQLNNASDGTPINVYRIDNSAPSTITSLSAISVYATQLTLSWEKPDDVDVASFILQQKYNEEIHTVAKKITTLGYNVSNLIPGSTYDYRVAAVDSSNNIGDYSEWLSVTTQTDSTSPVITAQSPAPTKFNTSIPFSVTASDDYGVKSISIQCSTDKTDWGVIESKTFTTPVAKQTQKFNISLSSFDEGNLYLRGIAEDFYGNVSLTDDTAPFVQYIVDKTPPQKPQQVSAIGGDGYITISWKQGNENDLGTYSVYRSNEVSGNYQRIATNLSSINYHDRSVSRDQVYYYKVTVYDIAGNLSDFSDSVSASAISDTEKPTVNSIYPSTQNRIGSANKEISVLFSDNCQLSTATIEYKTSLIGAYSILKEVSGINNYYKTVSAQLPLDEFSDGDTIYLRAFCTDTAGLSSEKATAIYSVDKQAPSVANVTIANNNSAVVIGWNDLSESDLAGFKVYRRVENGAYSLIGSRSSSATHQYSFNDKPSYGTITYRIDAIDFVGNTASYYSDSISIQKESTLQAVIDTSTYFETNVQETFSAESSTSDELIMTYEWDFGDGSVANKSSVTKSYSQPGQYMVALTITDVLGNVSCAERVITVNERLMLGTAKVRVVDEDGTPLAYMPVYFDLGESNQQVINTNSSGYASCVMSLGTHSVGAYKNGYLPAADNVDVLSGSTSEITLVVREQDLVTGEFEVHEMTFEEIIAAGIDINDPANQQIYEVNVTLTYGSKEIPVTYIRNNTGIISVNISNSGGGNISNSGGGNTSSSGGGNSGNSNNKPQNTKYQVNYIPNDAQQEIIAVMEIPATASYLKQFYSANLYILNNASEGFDIVDCEAEINAPNGLTIVQSSPIKDTIGGGETAHAGWILRGDVEGTYNLSADFRGILDRFNVPVSATFQAENSVCVYGADSIQIVVETPEHIFNNLPEDTSVSADQYSYQPTAYVNLGVKNVSSRDLYNVKIDVNSDIANITYEINNGETIEYDSCSGLISDSSKNKTYILDSNGTRREVPYDAVVNLAPGETLFRYLAVEFDASDRLDWFDDTYAQALYYELRDCVVNTSDYSGLSYDVIVNNDVFYDYYVKTGEPENGDYEFIYGTTEDNLCRKIPVSYHDSFFTKDSRDLDYELAKTTLRLELTAYSSAAYNAAYSYTLSERNYARATNIMNAYSQMGFYNEKFVGYDVPLTDGSDKAAYSMAMKYINNGSGKRDTLVALVVRGGGYGAEWASNFHLGAENNHKGFDGASEKVLSGIDSYVRALSNSGLIQGELKLWITGYSRGAATANLTAHKLNNRGSVGNVELKPSNMFAYTYATPQGAIDVDSAVSDENIFNFVAGNDLVPKVAMKQWGFGRYGVSHEISAFATNASIQSSYDDYVDPGKSSSGDFKISGYQKFTEDTLLALVSTLLHNRGHYDRHLQASVVEGYKQAYSKYDGEGLAKYILLNVLSGNTNGDFTILIEATALLLLTGFGVKEILGALVGIFGANAVLGKIAGFVFGAIAKHFAGEFLSNNVSETAGEYGDDIAKDAVENVVEDVIRDKAQDLISDGGTDIVVDIAKEMVNQMDGNNYLPFLENFYCGIFNAHYPEYYLACLDNLTVSDFKVSGSKMVQVGNASKLSITVTDDNGTLLSVQNGHIEAENIYAEMENDSLLFELPCDSEKTLSITASALSHNANLAPKKANKAPSRKEATDSIPSIVLKEFDSSGSYVRTVRFDIESLLMDNHEYSLILSDSIGEAEETYALVSSDNIIESTYDSLNLGEDYEITMLNGTASLSTAKENEFFVVSADFRENDDFIEWRSSTEDVFVDKTSAITSAKMPSSSVVIRAIYQSDKDGVDIVVDGDGGGTELGAGRYQLLDWAELIAEPNQDHSFMGWYDGDTLLSRNQKYRLLVTENKTITAKYSYSPHQHIWNNGEITKEATCKETGICIYTCVCGDSYTEPISALGHNWTAWVAVPDTDNHTRSCQRDGCNESEMAKHTWNDGTVTRVATCKETGTCTYTCTACNATKAETINKNSANHASYGTSLRGKTDATCTAKGYTGDTVCNGCGTVITKGSETAALGHTNPNSKGDCERCGTHLKDVDSGNKPTDNTQPKGDCPYCGGTHTGFFGWLIKFFHSILALFGLHK